MDTPNSVHFIPRRAAIQSRMPQYRNLGLRPARRDLPTA